MSTKLDTEEKVLKKMKLSDFSEMPKEKMMVFASMLDRMDPEVAKSAIEQFSNFKELATQSIDDGLNTLKELINADKEEDVLFYEHVSNEQQIYRELLQSDEFSPDQKMMIMDKLADLRKDILSRSKNAKMTRLSQAAITMLMVLGVTAFATNLLGGSSAIDIDLD